MWYVKSTIKGLFIHCTITVACEIIRPLYNSKNVEAMAQSKESENLVTFVLCLDYLNLTKFSALLGN